MHFFNFLWLNPHIFKNQSIPFTFKVIFDLKFVSLQRPLGKSTLLGIVALNNYYQMSKIYNLTLVF